jgi:cytoskeletal protein CcmA (bactofilin family)
MANMFGRAHDEAGPQQAGGKAIPGAGNSGQDMTETKPAPQGVAPPKPATDRGEYSVISAGLKIVGTIEGDGDIVVDGTVDGNIKGRMLTIGQGAAVNGEIEGETAHIRGAVSGKINARTVMLAGAAKVRGDITYENLSVELGAMWEGRSQRRKAQAGQKQAEATVAAKPAATPKAKMEATPEPEVKAGVKGAPVQKTNGADKTGDKAMKDVSAAA